MPLVLLFSPWPWATWIAIVSIWMLHTFIISTIPLAVPLEWNVFFMFCVAFLFANFHAGSGYAVTDMDPVLLAIVVTAALFPIVLGAFKPEYVSFLVGMKQYAGNWASATFSLRNKEIEDRINERIVKAADNQIDQIEPLFGKEISEIFIQKGVAFRMMHPMGRMHTSGLLCHLDDLDSRIQREGEFLSNVLTGWNFGDGHCLDERLIEGWQERCQYEPGDVVAVFTESRPAFNPITQYRVIDAALGCVEKGWYHQGDAYNTQPWLPDGPIPHTVTWRMPGVRTQGRPAPG
jgi:putative component of toxin-antitoxin plasmid stabilization module